jgi:hypothetical protein
MSIQSQVDRLNKAKTSLKSTMTSNGITVPSTTKIDGYSTLLSTFLKSISDSLDSLNGEVI